MDGLSKGTNTSVMDLTLGHTEPTTSARAGSGIGGARPKREFPSHLVFRVFSYLEPKSAAMKGVSLSKKYRLLFLQQKSAEISNKVVMHLRKIEAQLRDHGASFEETSELSNLRVDCSLFLSKAPNLIRLCQMTRTLKNNFIESVSKLPLKLCTVVSLYDMPEEFKSAGRIALRWREYTLFLLSLRNMTTCDFPEVFSRYNDLPRALESAIGLYRRKLLNTELSKICGYLLSISKNPKLAFDMVTSGELDALVATIKKAHKNRSFDSVLPSALTSSETRQDPYLQILQASGHFDTNPSSNQDIEHYYHNDLISLIWKIYAKAGQIGKAIDAIQLLRGDPKISFNALYQEMPQLLGLKLSSIIDKVQADPNKSQRDKVYSDMVLITVAAGHHDQAVALLGHIENPTSKSEALGIVFNSLLKISPERAETVIGEMPPGSCIHIASLEKLALAYRQSGQVDKALATAKRLGNTTIRAELIAQITSPSVYDID